MQCFLIKAKAFLRLSKTKKTVDVQFLVSKETSFRESCPTSSEVLRNLSYHVPMFLSQSVTSRIDGIFYFYQGYLFVYHVSFNQTTNTSFIATKAVVEFPKEEASTASTINLQLRVGTADPMSSCGVIIKWGMFVPRQSCCERKRP